MTRALQAFFLLLATATDRQIAKQVEYLRIENRILRGRLPTRIVVTPSERCQLVRFGKPLGSAIRHLIAIVTPRTFLRWVNGERKRQTTRPPGRPRTSESVEQLVLRIARETGWGYTRVLGELRKLGIRQICRSTVIRIMKEAGLDPGPKRGQGTWSEFLKRHAATLWACDFFTKKVWTKRGLVDVFVLFFIHVGTRRVHIAGLSTNPNGAWVAQQARNLAMHLHDWPTPTRFLIRDRDTKFTGQFDAILESEGIEVIAVGPRAPNMNAFAERFVQSVQQECLDHFIVFGEDHLRHIVTEFERHYNRERPHQSMGNRPLDSSTLPPASPPTKVVQEHRLGGLLKHYRSAA